MTLKTFKQGDEMLTLGSGKIILRALELEQDNNRLK